MMRRDQSLVVLGARRGDVGMRSGIVGICSCRRGDRAVLGLVEEAREGSLRESGPVARSQHIALIAETDISLPAQDLDECSVLEMILVPESVVDRRYERLEALLCRSESRSACLKLRLA